MSSSDLPALLGVQLDDELLADGKHDVLPSRHVQDPALETLGIQFQPYELGPIQASAFIDAAYYRTLGDREIVLTDTMQSTDNLLPPDTYTGTFGFSIGDSFWRATAGVRFYLSAR